MDIVLMIGCKKRSMESVVDFSCFGEMKLIHNR